MIRRPMSAVTDVNRGDVGVEDDGEEAGGGGSSGGDSADPGQTRLDALKDSVVARLLLDNRPPGLHTVACSSTTRRSSSGSDAVPRLRQLQPVVDLSAGIPKLASEDDRNHFRSDVTSASRRSQQLQQQLPPQLDLSTILTDCRLDTRWLDLYSRLPRSPPTSTQRRRPSGIHPRQSAATDELDVQAPAGDSITEQKSTRSSSHVLPALRRLLMKPIAGLDWIHRPPTKQSSFAPTRDLVDSPPTLKPEPLTTVPKIKQEFATGIQHNGSDVRDGLKTTSGFRSTPEVYESCPPRKRKSEVFAYMNSSDKTSGCDTKKVPTNTESNGEYPVQNGFPLEPEVERCPSDLSSAPPDITTDRSPNRTITQCTEGVVVDRRADQYFAHAPRKRFRYEFLSYIDDGTTANNQVTTAAARVDVGQTGNGNDVINLTTSTRASADRSTTRDVAVQCVMTDGVDEGETNPEFSGFKNARRSVHHPLASTFKCSTSADNLASFCWYCGIVFDDDVLHAIHMGCHSVADKFVCNVCGLACGDRYGFNSHLVRGHVQATAVSEQPASEPVLPLQLPTTARLVPQTTSLPALSRSTSTADSHRWTAYEGC